MQQTDTIQLIPQISILINRVIHFFGSSLFSTPQPDQVLSNIAWPDSNSKQSSCGSYKQPFSGGNNEAFVVQYWTSYHLR